MYEVTVYIKHGNLTIPVKLVSFDYYGGSMDEAVARRRAITFAKLIDKGFAVDVTEVADENNPIKGFGLVYHRDADLR